ncbi:nucleoside 2-deoxyribosyltransferase [Acetobacter oeni]|uniref:Nucleoside 2-deoxyribosyltransferase n=1 Tax=Acetobacter oeni TaxID=304077 RepID=A0A511XIJ5_9PROT|nr:nucleoside 2-deoxyribosyltransferase [Acetobacter oeni LMG 21952]GEN62756.1 nucleoside 2-deoxyribosyltransferase [Acetobacter oeni]
MRGVRRRPRIYLAGDLVFRPGAEAIFAGLKQICAEAGLEGVAPLDGQMDLSGLEPGFETTMAIISADRGLMDGCDAGLFCLDPFRRAADMDPGTAVEIGYMAAQGKPLCGYTVDGRFYPEKVRDYWRKAWGAELQRRSGAGGSGDLEDTDGIIVHSEGMVQNGMTEGFIRLSGGTVGVGATLCEAALSAIRVLAERLLPAE